MFDQKEATETCPNCGSKNFKRSVYKLPFDSTSYDLSRTLEKWHLNHIVESKCSDCGYLNRE